MTRTGFVWHERYMWHDAGTATGVIPTRGTLQPGTYFENPETKRRLKNLLDGYGVTDALITLEPQAVERSVLLRFHTPEYVDLVESLSQGMGGDAGETALLGPGSFDIACLAAGGALVAADAVISGQVDNAYVLSRPPGHHAERDRGRGFCLFSNIAVSALDLIARRRAERIAIVDWDVHHGNGTEQAMYERSDVLTISLHQDRLYPAETGDLSHNGSGAGEGFNINVPLPPGSGSGAYRAAMDRIVVPALRHYRPDLIIVACGFDASSFDPLGHMMLQAEDFAAMTATVKQLAAELCGGRLVLVHEGGYSEYHVPFCGIATIDELRGESSGLTDPFPLGVDDGPGALQPHQEQVVSTVVAGPLARLLGS